MFKSDTYKVKDSMQGFKWRGRQDMEMDEAHGDFRYLWHLVPVRNSHWKGAVS